MKLSVPIAYYDVNSDEITIINLSFHRTDNNVSNDQKMSVYNEIKLMIEESNNEEVLFSIIEYLRVEDYLHEKDEKSVSHDNFNNENILVGKSKSVILGDRCNINLGSTSSPQKKTNIENIVKYAEETENVIENEIISQNNEKCFYSEESEVKKIKSKNIEKVETLKIYHGLPIFEKKSQFASHFAFVSSLDQVHEFRNLIINDKKYVRATHHIFAFRFICTSTGKIIFICNYHLHFIFVIFIIYFFHLFIFVKSIYNLYSSFRLLCLILTNYFYL